MRDIYHFTRGKRNPMVVVDFLIVSRHLLKKASQDNLQQVYKEGLIRSAVSREYYVIFHLTLSRMIELKGSYVEDLELLAEGEG